jgi:hypothetical protein
MLTGFDMIMRSDHVPVLTVAVGFQIRKVGFV